MGDRNNPIKFGPEWLRNLAREGSVSNQNPGGGANNNSPGSSGQGQASGTTSTATTATSASATTNAHSKILLAKLRYGREEMLALYDRNSEAPSELKFIDTLYQPRGKPPFALNNTFEDEMESMQSGPPIGVVPPGERYNLGRGRGINASDNRGRGRGQFIRSSPGGRSASWHLGSPRMPGYSGSAEDDPAPPIRSWNNNNPTNVTNRNSGEQTDWASTKMYRSKRQGNNTNWRQQHMRDEGDAWRSDPRETTGRPRGPQDKYERDMGPQDKHPWSSNRRTWAGNDSQSNEENLPEWAVENAEACGGTFDASGAFHGYSNDDSNLPKSQEPSPFPLARSHTHGSFVRTKTAEERSEEWWASEKAKKLSPKRFDAGDIKFKKPANSTVSENNSGGACTSTKSNTKEEILQEVPEKEETPPSGATAASASAESNSGPEDDEFKNNIYKTNFYESKTFDALMRSEINLEATGDECSNFQSVMITPNNSLRQKHQNIVTANEVIVDAQGHFLQMFKAESKHGQQHNKNTDKIVEDILDMSLQDKDVLGTLPTGAGNPMMGLSNPSSSAISVGLATAVNSMSQISNPGMQMRMSSNLMSNQGMPMNAHSNNPNLPGITGSQLSVGMHSSMMQPIGITNSALNASLGLPIGPSMGSSNLGISLQGVPPPVMPNQGIANQGMANPGMASQGMGSSNMHSNIGVGGMSGVGAGLPGFPSSPSIQGLGAGNSSLFMGPNNNNPQMMSPGDIPMPNQSNQMNMLPMHSLQHSSSQPGFGTSVYGNMMQQSNPVNMSPQSLAEQWYYEDPKKTIQGPFSSKEMYNWYRAGFFRPSLMVRRACDAIMRPLGSYGPVVPFAQMDMMPPYPMFEPRTPGPPESMLTPQPGLGLDVDTLWGQPSPSADMMWMQQAINNRNDNRVNNLPMFFWDQSSKPTITPNALLPEEITKEMKTEDQILAQLRASRNIPTPQNIPYIADQPITPVVSTKTDEYPPKPSGAPTLEELEKFMATTSIDTEEAETQAKPVNTPKNEQPSANEAAATKSQAAAAKVTDKATKQARNEIEKAKIKEQANTKTKNKKTKEDKKEETVDAKAKEEDVTKILKRSEENSPSKNKKEEKASKKELEKEKKEWIKEGFTIVKGAEKNTNKDSKKKAEEAKAAEEVERKRKEDERLAAEEEKKRKQAETIKKQQEQQQQQQQRQATESAIRKAPWSTVAHQAMQATSKDGLTLAEIQRLEREKKLEQIKEQQQMMQIIAQQQAAALAREQEMQAGLGWAKKKGNNTVNPPGPSLAEIQAEARKQAAAAAAMAAMEEPPVVAPPPQTNHVPWGSSQNGAGFWDTQPNQVTKPVEPPQETPKKPVEAKKKPVVVTTPVLIKKEVSPAAEFETWCTSILASWSSKIDVPTFVGFLRDIESPYEVKDYVKCYLGESKDASDFARQFLERRSKLLRVGMVTPSDDLCSPAMAVNPRTPSGSDYQEGKGKKSKKNKMLKVDARILGFSVTASEDRINVGDIDTV